MKVFLNFSNGKLKLKKIVRTTNPSNSVQGKTQKPIPKIDFMYTQGYTKALLDVLHYFEEHSVVLVKNHVIYKDKTIKLLRALVTYREELRETGNVNLIEKNGEIKHDT